MPRGYTVQTHIKEAKLNKRRKALAAQSQDVKLEKENIKAQEDSQPKLQKKNKKVVESATQEVGTEE